MNKLFLALLFPLSAFAQSVGFVEGSIIGVTAGYPAQESPPPLIHGDPGMSGYVPPNGSIWSAVTVPNVPESIKAVFLWCVQIITNSQQTYTIADMHLYFRNVGALPTPPQTIIDYPCQAVQGGYGGQRSGCSGWVPVTDRKFQMWWSTSTTADPLITYSFKCYVNAYLR